MIGLVLNSQVSSNLASRIDTSRRPQCFTWSFPTTPHPLRPARWEKGQGGLGEFVSAWLTQQFLTLQHPTANEMFVIKFGGEEKNVLLSNPTHDMTKANSGIKWSDLLDLG